MTNAAQNARRFARERARRQGISLGRFRLIPGTDDSMLGREWVAYQNRGGTGMALVWLPIGDKNREEAQRNCTICKTFGGMLFGITVRT